MLTLRRQYILDFCSGRIAIRSLHIRACCCGPNQIPVVVSNPISFAIVTGFGLIVQMVTTTVSTAVTFEFALIERHVLYVAGQTPVSVIGINIFAGCCVQWLWLRKATRAATGQHGAQPCLFGRWTLRMRRAAPVSSNVSQQREATDHQDNTIPHNGSPCRRCSTWPTNSKFKNHGSLRSSHACRSRNMSDAILIVEIRR